MIEDEAVMKKVCCCVALWVVCSGIPCLGQNVFHPIPDSLKPQYRIHFSELFFPNRPQERGDYKKLESMNAELASRTAELNASAGNLLAALHLRDSIQVREALHDAYLYLLYAVNTTDVSSKDDDDALISETASLIATMDAALGRLPDSTFSMFLKDEPGLAPYVFEVKSSQRDEPYALPPETEKIVGALSPKLTGWQYQLYQDLIARTSFATVVSRGDTMNAWKDRTLIARSTDRSARKAGFFGQYRGFARQKDLYAFALLNTVKARNTLSRLHHYKDFPHQSYFALYLTVPDVEALLRRIEVRAQIYKRYQRLRIRHVKVMEKYTQVYPWDLGPGSTDSHPPRFSIREATEAIVGALGVLGNEYRTELSLLLDPANGRLDIVPGDHRLPAGGGVGFPGIPNVFYSSGFTGSYKDVSVLAHEGGHVVHYQLMTNNHVRPAYGYGPSYFSESFAIFNELLLADYLYRHEEDLHRRIFFLEQFLAVKGMEIFYAAHDADIEQSIYRGAEEGRIRTGEDLDTLTGEIDSRFSVWTEKYPELTGQWMTSRLMYEDPLYLVNYVYGAVLSLKYVEMFQRDTAGFPLRFTALLRNGFNDTPANLLKNFLDVNISDPALIDDDLKLLEGKVNELDSLYALEERQHAGR